MNLMWARGAYGPGVTPPTCPLSPFDPSTLSLSLWLEAVDCPSGAGAWASRASAGTSGLLSANNRFGSTAPQGLALVPSVAPCGLDTAQFRASPYAVLGLNYVAGTSDIIPGTDGTVVAVFKYVAGVTSPYGVQHDSAILEAFDDQWRVQMNGSGQARVSCTTSSGVQSAVTSNSVSSGDWCFVVAKFSGSSVSVQLNGGSVASFASPRSTFTQDRLLFGFTGTFGHILDMNMAELFVANYVMSAGDITNLKARADWYVGTTI